MCFLNHSQDKDVAKKVASHTFQLLRVGDALGLTKAPLVELWLQENAIGDAGAAAIAEGLKESKAPLVELYLRGNSISSEAKSALREAAKAIPSLSLNL